MAPSCITRAADLVTSHKATCDGFLRQAILKTEKASPYIKKAAEVWAALGQAASVEDLLSIAELRDALIATAGVSDKAKKYLTPQDIDGILKGIFKVIEETETLPFREELFYRYLLTRGDSLGGQMRNVAGAEGQRALVRPILAKLMQSNSAPMAYMSRPIFGAGWVSGTDALAYLDSSKVQAIQWRNRQLHFDKKPKLIANSVDAILIDSQHPSGAMLEEHHRYLACGELKAGVDPAGADEHWKTASSALDRIRERFQAKSHAVSLFYVGAAIQEVMAGQIFDRLTSGTLTKAANLTVEQQVEELVSWLVSL